MELNRDKIVKIARLTGCNNFVGKRKKFILNVFVHPWIDLRMGMICDNLRALTTARARGFWICWSRLS